MSTTAKIIGTLTATALVCAYPFIYYGSEKQREVFVKHKERIVSNTSEGVQSKYIVFGDTNEYEVTDSFLYFDFRASTRYNKLDVGANCTVVTAGWRVGFLSMYPNIVEVRNCVKQEN